MSRKEQAHSSWPPALWGLTGGLFACLLVFLPSSLLWVERFTLPKEVVLHVCAGLAASVCVARARRLRWDVVDCLIACTLVLGLISALFVAHNPWFAARSLAVFFSGGLVFWSARAVAEGGARDRLLLGSALAGGALALLMLLEAYGAIEGLSLPGRAPGGTIGNRNRAAHLLAIVLPVLGLCVARARRHLSLGLLLALTTASAGAVVLSRSRAAWVAALLAVTLALLARIRMRQRGAQPSRRAVLFTGATVLGATTAALAPNALAWASATPYLDTLQRLGEHESGSGRGRIIQYGNTLRMVREHAGLGVGPGNWTVAYPRYASPGDPSHLLGFLRPTDALPQGSWIGIAAEWGVPAFLLLALAACLLVHAAWRQIRTVQAPDSRMQGVALLCVLTAVLVIGLFDPVLQLPQAMFLVAVVVGALAPDRGKIGAVSLGRRTRGLAVGLVAALALAAALQSGRRMGAAHLVGNWSRPHTSPHRLERAIRIDPANYEAHVLLGAFWIRQGRCDLALPPLRQAVRLFPTASPIPELRTRCWHADPDTEAPAVVGASS